MSIENNLQIYNEVRKVPNEALKSIGAGRLKGMTDINPMWRIKAMTERFGPCGIGWRYEITKQWMETCGGEVKGFCNVNLYIKDGDEWSEAIPGTGGSSFVTIESKGPYVNDEVYKMALTDALSVAMKALGVGADIYYAKDADYGSKYELGKRQEEAQPKTSAQPKIVVDEDMIAIINSCLTVDDLKNLYNNCRAELRNNPDFTKEFTRRKNEITNTNKR